MLPLSVRWRSLLPSLAAGLILTIILYHSYTSIPSTLGISQQCRMSRMWPSYHLHTPDSPSGLGSKYRLYLYRENPPHTEHKRLDNARPAVFVHGNAGSYGQVRSVASYSWLQHQAHIKAGGHDPEIDWWSVDFNEDFSAFHAATLEQQSVYLNEVLAYLLTLYPHLRQDADIPILTHSMGGVVARLAILQQNYPAPPPIKTLVTLSTPHALPPAPIESGLQDIYDLINTPHESSAELAIISLSGGVLDTQLPSEYALLPPALASNALSFYTTDLPSLWSSVDHLAMMWCDQLRRRIVTGIAASLTATTPQDKLTAWKLILQNPDAGDPVEFTRFLEQSPIINLNMTDPRLHRYPIPDHPDENESFRVVTSHNPAEFDVFVCRQDACSPLPHIAFATIPASPSSSNSQQWQLFPQAETHYDSHSAREDVLRELRLNATHLYSHGWTSIRIVAPVSQQLRWWRAGWTVSNSHQSPVRTLRFPHVDSSLAQYSLSMQYKCHERQARMAPMVHVYNSLTGDGRWYPSLSFDNQDKTTLPVYLHSTSPFLQLPHGATNTKGLTVDVYYDSQACPNAIEEIVIDVDLLKSMGHLVSRYRVGLVPWPIAMWSFAYLAATSTKQLSHGFRLILALPPVLAAIQSLVRLPFPDIALDALFSLVQKSLQPFGWTLSDWVLTTALVYLALALGVLVLGLYMLLLTIVTQVSSYVVRTIPRLAHILRFDHVDSQTTSISKPKFRNSTIASIFITLLLVRISIPYQFVYLALTVMQLLNVVRTKIHAASSTKTATRLNQNFHLAIHLLLLLPLCAPALLVFVRNFIAAVQSSQSTVSHVGAGHAFKSAFSHDHNIFKVFPILLIVQILSTGRVVQVPSPVTGPKSTLAERMFSRVPTLIQVTHAVLALYALVYGVRHPYRLYDLSLIIFSLQVAGHYACRWGLVGVGDEYAAGRLLDAGRVGGDREERLPMSVRTSNEEMDEEQDVTQRLLLRNDDATARVHGGAAAAVAFSIPSSLMENGSESPVAEQTAPNQDSTTANPSQDKDKDASPLVSSSDKVNDLLTTYLNTLDAYTTQQNNLASTLSSAFFALSTDRMASGGWGSNVRKDLSNARLHRELQVALSLSVGSDADANGSAQSVSSKLESVPLPFLDDDAITLDDEKKDAQASTLRQRRKGRQDEKGSSSDSDMPTDIVDEKKKNKKPSDPDSSPPSPPRPRRQHPSALQQYSALPSANLRKAQSGFKDALGLIAADDDALPTRSLVHLRLRLAQLEDEIRRFRKDMEGKSKGGTSEQGAYSI